MSKGLVEIKGFEQLERKIKLLKDDKVKKREVLKILGQLANPTVKAARSEAPKSKKNHYQGGKRTKKLIKSGNLKRSIGKITGRKGSARVNAVLYVGPKSKGRKNDGWYGAFVEGGTIRQAPNPFMLRAYQKTKGEIPEKAEQRVSKYIQRQIDRLSR